MLSISSYLASFAKILVEHVEKLAPSANDPLREILNLLGPEPSIGPAGLSSSDNSKSSLNSNQNSQTADKESSPKSTNNSKSSLLNKNTQLCLTLTSRFTPSSATDDKVDMHSLLIK